MKKISILGSIALLLLLAVAACIPQPQRPQVNFSPVPEFQAQIAEPEDALSFAYDKQRAVLLVVEQTPEQGILAHKLAGSYTDAFAALKSLGQERLVALANTRKGAIWYPLTELAPVVQGSWHVAVGGNFVAHADETQLEKPFVFPKALAATSAWSKVSAAKGALLDYEVELCMTFDRDISAAKDFNNALKGVFLCADTTDRATLLRDLPADEEHFGGRGFTDAKSYPGFFSTGPIVVIPNDWRAFVQEQPITTFVDGELMQYAYGEDMVFDFEKIASFALEQWDKAYWEVRDRRVKLLDKGVIKRGSALLSGTGEGVIFRPPTSISDLACGGAAYVCAGAFLQGLSGRDYVIERFIRANLNAKTFLQPGETVLHSSQHLGSIQIDIE